MLAFPRTRALTLSDPLAADAVACVALCAPRGLRDTKESKTMKIFGLIVAACGIAMFANLVSGDIVSISSDESSVSAGSRHQSGHAIDFLSVSDESYPTDPNPWQVSATFTSSVQGSWWPSMALTHYSAQGSVSTRGKGPPVSARLAMVVELDHRGFYSISTSGSYTVVLIEGVSTVVSTTGNNSVSGWLSAGRYQVLAEAASGSTADASFSLTIPSPGTLALASLTVGLLSPKRRRHDDALAAPVA